MHVWGLCVSDLTALFIVGESSSESVVPLQRLGRCRSLCREVVVVRQEKATPLRSSECVCVCVSKCMLVCVLPVEGSAGGHTPGKALDSQLSEVGDDGKVGSHDGH